MSCTESIKPKEERLKSLAQSWRNLALGYEIRGKKAADAGEVKRYAAMNGTMLHCADALEKALACAKRPDEPRVAAVKWEALLPPEKIALMMCLDRITRGEDLLPNTAYTAVLGLARLSGLHDWREGNQNPAANLAKALDLLPDPRWQPIETVPKDGTPFLCGFWDRTASNYFWITKAHWANGAVDGGWDGAREPIELVKAGYWMPLPVAPELVEAAS